MSTNDNSDAKMSKATLDGKSPTGKEIAKEEAKDAERAGLLSVGREGEIDAGPDTQLAPGILDSGTF